MTAGGLQPGQMCGPYEIEREIGRGGMSVVYLARDPHGLPRAIKTLQLTGHLHEEQMDRFVREIQLLATIDHVHVVRFIEAGSLLMQRTGTLVWVALEYLEGQTLRAIINERGSRIDVEDLVRWCKHIADGVAAVHELRVVHRDLKPENVAIVQDVAKVFDFGIAKYRRWGVKTTHFKTRLGTVGYMAPEQLSGSDVDERSDVFALGIILYELATGEHPFCRRDQGLTAAEAIARCLTLEPVRLDARIPGFPEDVARIAERALAKDRERRYPNMAEMRDALDRALKRYRSGRRSLDLGPISNDWQVPPSLGEVPPSAVVDPGLPPTMILDAPPAVEIAPTPLSSAGPSVSGSIPGVSMEPAAPERRASPWLGRGLMGLGGALLGTILGAAASFAVGSSGSAPSAAAASSAVPETEPAPTAAASAPPPDPAAVAAASSAPPETAGPEPAVSSSAPALPSPAPVSVAPPAPPRPQRPPPPASTTPKKTTPVFGSTPEF